MIRFLASRSNGGFRMKPSLFLVLAVLAMARGMPAIADDTRIGVTPDEIQWGQVEGLGLAVILQGDPAKSRSYILRIKVPPNNITQPHVHQQAENITVISGSFGFGLGTVFDRSKGRVLSAGSFVHLPANTSHFAWTGADGAVIQANGDGPFP
jgi:quercetin dioxygenase-like cupin family protein